jgi:hypothetical protein
MSLARVVKMDLMTVAPLFRWFFWTFPTGPCFRALG